MKFLFYFSLALMMISCGGDNTADSDESSGSSVQFNPAKDWGHYLIDGSADVNQDIDENLEIFITRDGKISMFSHQVAGYLMVDKAPIKDGEFTHEGGTFTIEKLDKYYNLMITDPDGTEIHFQPNRAMNDEGQRDLGMQREESLRENGKNFLLIDGTWKVSALPDGKIEFVDRESGELICESVDTSTTITFDSSDKHALLNCTGIKEPQSYAFGFYRGTVMFGTMTEDGLYDKTVFDLVVLDLDEDMLTIEEHNTHTKVELKKL